MCLSGDESSKPAKAAGKQTPRKDPLPPWKNGVPTQEYRLRGPLPPDAASEMRALSRLFACTSQVVR